MTISLPVESESVRCVDFAQSIQLDPGGTALAPDVVVLVEVDEPWPKPVGKHESLVELVRAAQEWPEQIRLLAAVPMNDEPRRVIAFRPTTGGASRSERVLCADPVGALQEVLSDDAPTVLQNADGIRTMLICTQGSHDVCCGEDGEAYAQWVDEHHDLEVFRVSHTGGHRFAPTAMTLPDGRMWAYLDDATTNALVARDDMQWVVGQCRGWWGAPTGPAQVAERAVFAELGYAADLLERSVVVGDADHDGQYPVAVSAGEDIYDVLVTIGREVPTIACSAPGGLPAKPGREWTVVSGPTRR